MELWRIIRLLTEEWTVVILDGPTIEHFKGSIVYVARLACKPLRGAHDQVNREWSIPVVVVPS
jgi:hypothetical protein